jgi:hypothetical protein
MMVLAMWSIKGRGTVALFLPHEVADIDDGDTLERESDEARWTVRGVETQGYKRTGGLLLRPCREGDVLAIGDVMARLAP